MKVLLVDDDADLLDVTAYALQREGFSVVLAGDGQHALRLWEEAEPDVVVLDVRLPKMNGLEVCQYIRQNSSTPVILLTALAEEEQIVQGFRMGADDYVTKPFSPRQLTLRIEAVWRRGIAIGQREPIRQVCIGDMTIDAEAHEVLRNGVSVALTLTEFRILYLLATNLGRVVPSARLVDYAWGHDGGHPSLLKTHVSHIRTKLGLPSRGPGGIDVLPMVGYRLTAAGDGGRGMQLISAGPGRRKAVERNEQRLPLRVLSTAPLRANGSEKAMIDGPD